MVRILLIVAALLVAVLSGWMVQRYLTAQRQHLVEQAAAQRPAAVPSVEVLVVNADLDIATLISPNQLIWQAWPEARLHARYISRKNDPDALTRLAGSAARQPMYSGEPITEDKLIKKSEGGFLAAVVRRGYRALSIKVDEATGLTGLLNPGDRVDVILSHEIQPPEPVKAGPAPPKEFVGETIARDLRVLAIDQSIGKHEDTKGKQQASKTVTLEVDPEQAEVLALGKNMGTLALALRSAFGTVEDTRNRTFTLSEEVGAAQRAMAAQRPAPQAETASPATAAETGTGNTVTIYHGAIAETVTVSP